MLQRSPAVSHAPGAVRTGQAGTGHRRRSLRTKRAFDLVFSLLVVALLLSWVVPLVALVVKLTSRGPVFFRQLRTGKDGQPFYCYKFRSMRAHNASPGTQATAGDARITRVGAFLRKTSLDELPQFLNVLRGEMSVVGPRPHMLQHTDEYARVVPGFMQRHAVTPGITGLAQVRGYRGETKAVSAMAKRVRFDVWYINHGSLGLDVKIVTLTVRQAVLGHPNAR
ncbi:sugar transferase [Hymenobacter coccineus]|nr:sugar transferase [Hymenobacter coccineus]